MSNTPAISGLFVTGSGTGVGKTYVTCLLARALRELGIRVGVYKPAASGGRLVDGKVVCADAVELWEAAGRPLRLSDVCPQMFAAPLAPHLAARAEGKSIDEWRLITGLDVWRGQCDIVLVEGAGGFMSPLSPSQLNADLAVTLGFPILSVVPNRLGMIHDALQSVFTALHYPGAPALEGLVINHPTVDTDPSQPLNVEELQRHCSVPIRGEIPHAGLSFPGTLDWLLDGDR